MHGIIAKRLGHRVTILEQYENATREGQAAGIAAMEYGTKSLKKHDLLLQDHLYAVNCPGVQILNNKAEVKMKVDRPLTMTSWNVLYYRLRANFDGLKSNDLSMGTTAPTRRWQGRLSTRQTCHFSRGS